jgi:TP901 family phage tail tape measure protein
MRVEAISGAYGEDLAMLEEQAKELGRTTSFSSTEAAEGMENLASAGFDAKEIYAAMPGLLSLAATDNIELASAAEIAAAAINGFGLEAGDAGHVADVLAESSARTNASVSSMGEAFK